MKACACSHETLAAQGARAMAVEADNASFRSELKQACRALVEAESARDMLSTSLTAMEQECVKLRVGMDTLEQEKTKIAVDSEAQLVASEKKFCDYQISQRKKLHDLRMELEHAMNEIGVRCLPYPSKGSTIGAFTAWFTQEIQALPDAIAKANKNFLVYCLIGALKMLQEHM
jgi:uncharacterized ubiquitin-like protein YukD